ncbi:MAG: serine dehydratase subunit alpha family protein [Anaerolineaceae bacterium]|nr:serine dehydratase subunit alpha family protein [Anaerolineaceae bacterium]
MLNRQMYLDYVKILEEELVPATGCTEPIAIALAAAKAREMLHCEPEKMRVLCSRNIFKNTRSVTVPNSNGLIGIKAAAILGAIGGKPYLGMQVISEVEPSHVEQTQALVEGQYCEVGLLESDIDLHIQVEVVNGPDSAFVEIKYAHTNITLIKKNGQMIYQQPDCSENTLGTFVDRSILSVERIFEFANQVDLDDVRPMIETQIEDNMAIAEYAIHRKLEVGLGQLILSRHPEDEYEKARAYASAASEARMSGIPLPVVTNSGSGNQGITSSVPLIILAKTWGASEEQLIRTLVFSNLLTIHQKSSIGKLSAFCGAISAACAAGAGMTYLKGGSLQQINWTISNVMANIPGVLCDGAKPSCAAKIATGLDAAILGHQLAMQSDRFNEASGILQADVEVLIRNMGKIAKQGMAVTDQVIMDLIVGDNINKESKRN